MLIYIKMHEKDKSEHFKKGELRFMNNDLRNGGRRGKPETQLFENAIPSIWTKAMIAL
jgi:hypothetical protein